MRKIISLLMIGTLILGSCGRPKVKVRLTNQVDTVSYFLGLYYAKNLKHTPGFDKINTQAVAMAFDQVFSNDSIKVTPMEIQMKLSSYFRNLQMKSASENLKKGEDFLAANKNKPGVVSLPNGLQYKVLKNGNGPRPDSTDIVVVNYTGKTIDGKTFDSSIGKKPATFELDHNIPGFREALVHMNVGSKWEIYIPSDLAYGPRGVPNLIQPNSALIFDIELLNINPKAPVAKKK